MNLGDKRDAYRGILVAGIIQLLICISYVLVANLGAQSLIPDKAEYVNALFTVNEKNILGDTPVKIAQLNGNEELALKLIKLYKAEIN